MKGTANGRGELDQFSRVLDEKGRPPWPREGAPTSTAEARRAREGARSNPAPGSAANGVNLSGHGLSRSRAKYSAPEIRVHCFVRSLSS